MPPKSPNTIESENTTQSNIPTDKFKSAILRNLMEFPDDNYLLNKYRIKIDRKKETAIVVLDDIKYKMPLSTIQAIVKLFDVAQNSNTGISYLPKNSLRIINADNQTQEEMINAQSSRYYFEIDRQKGNAIAVVDNEKYEMNTDSFYHLQMLYYAAKDNKTGMAYLSKRTTIPWGISLG